MNLTPYSPARNANGEFPSLTTFAGEQRVLTIGREALVSVNRANGMGRMLVAVSRTGYHTDYPAVYNSQGVVQWDSPERFSKRFKERARAHVLSFYGKT